MAHEDASVAVAVAEEVAGAPREASLPAAAPPEISGSEPPEDQKMLSPRDQKMLSPRESANSAPPIIISNPPQLLAVEKYAGTQSELHGYASQDVANAKDSAAIKVASVAAEQETMQ